jgi:hypothetical protein
MPDTTIAFNQQEQATLELIRVQQGLDSIEQAAEWLIKSRLRKHVRQFAGRGRSLYPVEKKPCA